jgi:hypothetical protein
VGAVDGVISSLVYDTHVDPADPLSIGFKVRVRTTENEPIYLDDADNTPTGKLIHELVQLVKPAGVQYIFDTGNGYGIKVKIVVVGIDYPDDVIRESIISVLKYHIRSVSYCKPLDYGYILEAIIGCAKGVKIVKSLELSNGTVVVGDTPDDPIEPGDPKLYVSSPFTITTFGAPYHVPQKAYAYFDELNADITIATEKVLNYGGCGRSNNCY